VPLDRDCSAAGSLGSDVSPAARATRWFAAHELRTPLQGIQGGVALLLEERGAGLSALQLEALGLISAATADLERCIAHLGELAAVETSPAAPRERLAIGALVRAAAPAPGLAMTPALAAAATLDVLVVPTLARRALGRLVGLAHGPEAALDLVCDLAEIEDDRLTLVLPAAPGASGDGAVLWQLAAAEMQCAGASLEAGVGGTSRITLHRAPDMPICL
jgi:signal transduction histidine kinase